MAKPSPPAPTGPVQQDKDTADREASPAGVDERRRAARAVLKAEVSFKTESNFYLGFGEDVSEGGLFVATYDVRPIGTALDLEFTLPGGREVHTRGEVRWLRASPSGMGVRFLSLAAGDKGAITAFVQKRSPLFYDD